MNDIEARWFAAVVIDTIDACFALMDAARSMLPVSPLFTPRRCFMRAILLFPSFQIGIDPSSPLPRLRRFSFVFRMMPHSAARRCRHADDAARCHARLLPPFRFFAICFFFRRHFRHRLMRAILPLFHFLMPCHTAHAIFPSPLPHSAFCWIFLLEVNAVLRT